MQLQGYETWRKEIYQSALEPSLGVLKCDLPLIEPSGNDVVGICSAEHHYVGIKGHVLGHIGLLL